MVSPGITLATQCYTDDTVAASRISRLRGVEQAIKRTKPTITAITDKSVNPSMIYNVKSEGLRRLVKGMIDTIVFKRWLQFTYQRSSR